MSYRAFKRLLGETSLERKCRFLFGTGVVLLILLSFSLYAYQTEHLAYDQTVTTCRLLVTPIVVQHHVSLVKNDPQKKQALPAQWANIDQVILKDSGREYQYHFLIGPKGDDSYEQELYKEFLRGDGKPDDYRQRSSDQVLLYYAPIRVANECMSCHK